MANYVGYFRAPYWVSGVENAPLDSLYTVKLITNSADTGFTEIALAGDNPFTVRYEAAQTPFEPVLKSTATITIVHNSYLEDVLSPYAHGTRVSVTRNNGTSDEIVWDGYLTPKVYNQGYDDCFENIELEAADCLTSLQYYDYEVEDIPVMKTLDTILNQIVSKCENIDRYYWGETKHHPNGTMVKPDDLSISEVNFFSSDTDKVWNLYQVLEEICRYMGFNVFYHPYGGKNCIWFLDKWALSRSRNANAFYYQPNQEGEPFIFAGMTSFTSPLVSLNEKSIGGNGADISFEPVYNKATVRDNFYFVEDWLPGIFDDDYLANRITPCYRYNEYKIVGLTDEDKKHNYYQRPLSHKYWKSIYRDSSDNVVNLSPDALATSGIVSDYRGATIVEMGTIGVPEKAANESTITWRYGYTYEPSKIDYKQYLCISEKGGIDLFRSNQYQTNISGSTVFKITDFPSQVVPSQNAYLIINFDSIFEKFPGRPYINPEWDTNPPSWGNNNSKYVHASFPIILKIGDKYWDGYTGEWTTEPKYFVIKYNRGYTTQKSNWDNENPKPNTTEKTLNSVSWSFGIDAEGYLIPLNGVNMSEPVSVTFCTPTRQWVDANEGNPEYNAYCWLSDISFKIAEPQQDSQYNDNDIVYENVIDEDAVNEYEEITFKITTATKNTKPAYSNMAVYLNGTWRPLEGLFDSSLEVVQTPEANLVEKIVTQYSTPTKKINITLKDNGDIGQLSSFKRMDVEKPDDIYMPLGFEYNYGTGQILGTYIQVKG